MAYEKKPNEATLWGEIDRPCDLHPTHKGQIVITRSLLIELSEQQGKGGDFAVDISAWQKTTQTGKNIINLKIEKPKKLKGDTSPPQSYPPAVIREPPQPQPPAPKAPPTPEKYLAALKDKIAKIENYPDFEILYKKIHSPEVWQIFKANAAIAQEASTLLSVKKGQLVLATEPVDLSAIISALDVECDRLKLGKKEHCLIRWNKPRAMLSIDELQTYLQELKAADPASDDFF